MHSLYAGLQDIHLVDFLGAARSQSPCHGTIADPFCHGFALTLIEFLGVP